jgi:two-component system, LytTR family, sensor kinase
MMLDNWIKKSGVRTSDIGILLLCAAFIFPLVYPDFAKFAAQKGAIRGIFNALLFYYNIFFVVIIVVYYMLPYYLNSKNILILILMLLGLLTTEGIIARYMRRWICGCEVSINFNSVSFEMQNVVMIAAPVSMVLFIKRLLDSQNRFLIAEKEKKEAELKLLKQQIDPHFLFNNLNVLGVLIQKDKMAANEYLQRFANLYRYLIRHKDEDVVLLEEELQFVSDYIFLLKQRFGDAYNFKEFQNLGIENIPNRMILPGAIQALIENIIKHNQGEEQHPLPISVSIKDDYFIIRNEVRKKYQTVDSTKTGLKNLQMRYQLLSDKDLIINILNDSFEVKVPLISYQV